MSRKDFDEQRSLLEIWKQKLTFLKREQAIVASPVELFELKIRIEECQEEIERINSQLEYPQNGEELISNQSTIKPEIGIITALSKEYAAVRKVLENTQRFSFPGQGGGRQYLLGEVSINHEEKHAVVLCLASMGNNAASIRASSLLNHFPYLKSIIMVGIAGGIPHPEKPEDHVRLGDIVVSNEKGVIQYDFDKETITETSHRHPPRPPSCSLLEGVRLLEADELMGEKPWLKFIAQALLPEGEKRPPTEKDILVSSTDPNIRLEHPQDRKRKHNEPRVFIAPIASANKLLKNPIKRDKLRDKFGVKAVEMESSGVADATWNHEIGYLVVRGICDYCDSNKGDDWQAYAAAVAAAYTRALLESMPVPKKS
ncbi:MAG: 5'-methylthioadenosine/S-adenosylhomocysteine nucleosidase [Spirulinaceae cyanobacterium]